ncbi:TauD/TfdA dioxygenase family protein [Pseudonocardia sp. HH130630-07]|uniref:TauD/TfdA dioxygenase family protein n=1 Tax=Pseudonocardia sp. HH130630-07 TaxID=1690815 RepID=UPI000814E440|nr:TauD/TfdA family dioxygenase [Pseudonocardia sp. HH130630-07]ANY05632.1 taurine dioxygenase [Pseudonocardia sp. HH130630-07]
MVSLDVRPVSGALGAEVRGLALADVDDDVFARLHELLLEHLVLFLPDNAGLAAADHEAFGRRLGPLEVHPFLPKLDGHDEIVVLDSDQGAKADVWHTDVTFSPAPPIASVLQIVQGPEVGGDTMWSNQYLAYEALSAPLRELLEGLTALHVFEHPNGSYRSEAEHPVVRVHPETGRRSLYVNRMFTRRIPQLTPGESTALLAHLFDVGEGPQRVCRYRWTEGGVAIWDNRATQHYAVNDYTGRRVGRRVTVLGDHPEGEPARWPHHQAAGMSATAVKD